MSRSIHFPDSLPSMADEKENFLSSDLMPPPPIPSSFYDTMNAGTDMYSLTTAPQASHGLSLSGLHYEPDQILAPALAHCSSEYVKEIRLRLPSDQIQQVIEALSPRSAVKAAENGVSMAQIAPPTFVESSKLRQSSYGLSELPAESLSREHGARRNVSYASDVSMHVNCDQFPRCIVDSPDGRGVFHSPLCSRSKEIPSSAASLDKSTGDTTYRPGRPSAPKGTKRHRNTVGDEDLKCAPEVPRKFSKGNGEMAGKMPQDDQENSIL